LIAHGGELTVSAGGVVARIKDQGDVPRLQDVAQAIRLAVVGRQGEVRRLAADGEHFTHVRLASSRSSHSSGTSIPPNGAWVLPSSVSPCQSEPPLIPSPRRSARRVRRASVPASWLGWRTSRPSSPCSLNCRTCPSLPRSPR